MIVHRLIGQDRIGYVPADPKLDAISDEELTELSKDIDKALATEESRRKTKARDEIDAKAREFDFTLEDFAVGSGKKARSGPASQSLKYRHPENMEMTWSGRGRQPTWFREAMEGEAAADDLLISQAV